jgi:hypothetical protein
MSLKANLACIALCSFLAGCPQAQQTPPSPAMRPDGPNRNWTNVEDMTYIIGDTDERIVVPKGFVTDFASIPLPLWSLGLSPHGQYSRAAIIHDFLYWSQGCTRAQADRLMVIAMKESQVAEFDEAAIYAGVNIFGSSAWAQNQAERAQGVPRVIPEQYLRPADPNMQWADYRKQLFALGVRDPEFQRNPSYCRYGDSTAVPKKPSQSASASK